MIISMTSSEVFVKIGDKTLKGILAKNLYRYNTKKRLRRGRKSYEVNSTSYYLHIYINRNNLADYYLIIPLKSSDVKFIDGDKTLVL